MTVDSACATSPEIWHRDWQKYHRIVSDHVMPTVSLRRTSWSYFELAPAMSMKHDVNLQTGIDMANARRHASVDVSLIREFLHGTCISLINCCIVHAYSAAARFQVVVYIRTSEEISSRYWVMIQYSRSHNGLHLRLPAMTVFLKYRFLQWILIKDRALYSWASPHQSYLWIAKYP